MACRRRPRTDLGTPAPSSLPGTGRTVYLSSSRRFGLQAGRLSGTRRERVAILSVVAMIRKRIWYTSQQH